uniref:Uncharacterized protein n=1 Tax=Lactuca sativa TaxID=4236 RepID=A0A9R1WIG7_LACSA|nr:hypothetical protein LSAT_V11C100012790 [Lactuca sativa]
MESSVKGSLGKKNFLIKKWERCRSIHSSGHSFDGEEEDSAGRVFPVYVGPEKQWLDEIHESFGGGGDGDYVNGASWMRVGIWVIKKGM